MNNKIKYKVSDKIFCSWEEMEWNVAGNVSSSGTVNKDDLCSRYDVSFVSD